MSTYDTTQVANALTDFALQYENGTMIADLVCPPVSAPKRKFKFWKYLRKDVHHISVAAVTPTGLSNMRHYGQELSDEITVLDYALHDYVPGDEISQADMPLEFEQDTTEDLTRDLLLAREKRVADLIMTAASYATANKVTLSTAWTSATANVINDIQTGIRACASPPNKMIMDKIGFDALARHPQILSTLRGSADAGMATADEIGRHFGLKIFVGDAKYNTANDGQTASLSYVWPVGQVVIAHIPDEVRPKQITLCRTFRNGPAGRGAEVAQGAGMNVVVWTEEKRGAGKGAIGIKVGHQEVHTLIAADAGYHITGAAA